MKENGINRNLCTTQRRWIRKESKGEPQHGVEGAVLIHRIVSQIDGPRDSAVALVRLFEGETMHRILMHMDSDGYAAGAVIAYWLEKRGIKDYFYHPINYGLPIPPQIDFGKDHVYLVDFSIQPDEEMKAFAEKLEDRLVWIDHHKTAISAEENLELKTIEGIRNDGPISGCELTWLYCFKRQIDMPPVLKLVGDWDTWRHTQLGNTEEASALQMYLRTFKYSPVYSLKWWTNQFEAKHSEDLRAYVKIGKTILKYQEGMNISLMSGKAFECKFHGLNAIAINQGGNSVMFDHFYNPEKHDVMLTFQWVGLDYLTVSLYSTKPGIDCGKIARDVGYAGDMKSGGGHPGAAGFQCGWEYFRSLVTDPVQIKNKSKE